MELIPISKFVAEPDPPRTIPARIATPPSGELTWRELLRREPRLATLRDAIKAVEDDGTRRYFCANEHWYGVGRRDGFKAQLCDLVGWGATRDDPALWTMEAYDLAYERLYALLPDCRGDCLCG